jgi:Flp pilus assembly protein TadG
VRDCALTRRPSWLQRNERGQAFLFTVVWMVVLLGMAGLVIDFGSWYLSQRRLQADADAAALAGAQQLPDNVAAAEGDATSYAQKNGYSLPPAGMTISGAIVPNDSITVDVDKSAPTFFMNLFGVSSVAISATATARSDLIGQARYVAPIAVNIKHPLLTGPGCPCFGVATTLPLGKTGAPGAFDLIDLDNSSGNGASTLGSWILNGYNGYLGLGSYSSNTGAKFSSANVQNALNARIGTVLLFPVYDTLTSQGTNAQYNVIAWVGFQLTGVAVSGNSGSLDGSFTTITWEGIAAAAGSGEPDLGARTFSLTQ